ncbi:MAG: Rieske (2Fe-2S) protein [Alphaproteobacteria bacterium]|nr:Rieske (2Fe-2S) protein [Alphaproteobacteria bacterium]
MTPAPGYPLCALAEIPDGGGRGFVFGGGTERRAIFVVRRGDRVFAYENSCPHVGTPLDWVPDQFLDRDGAHILCSTHGALFRIEDGYCLSGPCAGDRLSQVAVAVRDGMVVMRGGTAS